MLISFCKKIILLFWFVMVFLIFFSSLKEQLVLSKKTQKIISTFFPEGWSFFTKNPQTQSLAVYQIIDGNLVLKTVNNHNSQNMYGLSRYSRIIGFEASMLANEAMKLVWKQDVMGHLRKLDLNKLYKIEVMNNRHLTNGTFLLVLYKPVPYAWAKAEQFNNIPIKYITVHINSPNDR
ncbi:MULTISPECIES: SdpA family antimicrobial peptide system protein [unclassified Sphingobacterium]|nr:MULTISPECIES: SdpA family antimicrobial peptide system protein [unclassified Sphingobacterium]MCS3553160.1 antimicrobial peptide system SdpA family protein [Sphingobacterium sp. JUb21]